MSIAGEPWSLVLKPGKQYEYPVERDFRVTNAALGEEVAIGARSVVKVSYIDPSVDSDDEEDDGAAQVDTVLCALRAGTTEQTKLDVTFPAGTQIVWTVTGANDVYLLGNFILHPDMPPYGSEFSDDEDGYRLEDVSSDVEMPAGMDVDDDSDEEEEKPKPASKKRPRESDGAELETPDLSKLSKNARKKLAKKLKGEDGEAIPVGAADDTPAKDEKKSKKDKKEKDTPSKKEKETPSKKDASEGETRTLPNGLKIKDAKPGTGPAAKKGQRLSMRYIGKTGGKIFDKNTSGAPFAFKLGRGEVIKGWDEGLVGMRVGGERVLTIPGNLAYGPRPPKGSGIPPNATLTFEVKLLSVS